MPNSNGEASEKTPAEQGDSKKAAQNKRKRNRNRKKNATKVENLVSKTFQAKLVANSSLTESTVEIVPAIQAKSKRIEQEVPGKGNEIESPSKKTSPSKACAKLHTKSVAPMGDTSVLKDNKEPITAPKVVSTMVQQVVAGVTSSENSREEILAEREVKKLAKKMNKGNNAIPNSETVPTSTLPSQNNSSAVHPPVVAGTTPSEKSREDILAEREAKKLAKQQAKKKNKDSNETPPTSTSSSENNSFKKVETNHLSNGEPSNQKGTDKKQGKQESKPASTTSVTEKLANLTVSDTHNDIAANTKDKKPVLSKAERRAIQEAQRTAKADASTKKTTTKPTNLLANEKKAATVAKEVRTEKSPSSKSTKDCKVKLFNHLESCRTDSNLFVNNQHIHPIIVKLGEQYAKRTVVGSNARCISFLSSLKQVIQDYETPAKKEFARSLETAIKNSVDHLHKCRPLAVSVWNAYKHIKHVLTQLPVDQPESELKEHLCHFVDTYIENQIGKAAEAISSSVQDKISNGDVILTFGCSSLINYIFEEAHRRHVDFRVIVVDSRPFSEGQELLRRLTAKEIPCTYVLINAVGFVMPEVTKILLGAHALLSNGYVMARTGTAQVALVARSFNVPVLVCCETHKFSERFQTDAIVYNELGNPDDLVISDKCRLMNWQSQNKLSPLNLNYDITPPELVTAVVTEVAILPCTSVPVILRIKPTEIGY